MRRLSIWLTAAIAPALVLAAMNLGCSGGAKTEAGGGPPDKGGTGEPVGGAMKPAESSGRGTIKGKVTLAGGLPESAKAKTAEMEAQMKARNDADKGTCLSPDAKPFEKEEQEYRVGKDNGLQYVVVWVKPPSGTYFKLDDSDLKPYADGGAQHTKILDQPHCAFIPHVMVLFPSYFDGKEPKKTGQVVEVKNSAPILHNTKWGGTARNQGGNPQIEAGKIITINVVPENGPIPVGCSIHGWMTGYMWAFEHPFATVTDEDGNYEIKNVPAGVKLKIVAWHEKAEYNISGKSGQDIEVKKDATETKNFEAKKP